MPHPAAVARIGPGCVSRWRTSLCDAVLAAAPGQGNRVASQAFLPWRSPLPAAKSAPSCSTSIRMASSPMATSASPSRSAAAASRSRSSAICPWPWPTSSPASSRAVRAPRCRCSEARASAGSGFLAGLSAGSAGRVQEPCGKIEAPQALTAKEKRLKG